MKERTQVLVVGAGPVGIILSRLLHRFGVRCTVLEKRLTLRHHPQAHYINNRSLEILRSFFWAEHVAAMQATPASLSWRDFVYCHTVKSDYHFLREDQFARTDESFWLASPTSSLHLAQNAFEKILLRSHLQPAQDFGSSGVPDGALLRGANPPILFGHELQNLTYDANGATAHVRTSNGESLSMTADFLVACDGSHSRVRSLLGIPMDGEQQIQSLMNVHFCCPGLRDQLRHRTAMLYFVFNEAMVCVYVSHDVDKDEWICQIPYFPPFQSPSDFSEARVLHLLRQTLFDDPHDPLGQRLQLRAVHHWAMHAQVARHFVHPPTGRIFLAGDAAHRFPPAGGFGMNTGLQDAHNLAWKLAHVLHGQASLHWLGTSYAQERKRIAEENTRGALANYHRSVSAARVLGVDPKYAAIAGDVAQASVLRLVPSSVRTQAFLSALQLGLTTLRGLRRWPENVFGRLRVEALQRLSRAHETLPLLFPEADLAFSYVPGAQAWQTGRRLEHFWLLLQPPPAGEGNPPQRDTTVHGGHTLDTSAVVVSSLDLPAVVHTLRGMMTRGGGSAAEGLPPAIILVRGEAAAAAEEGDKERDLLAQVREGLVDLRGHTPRVVWVYLSQPSAGSTQHTCALLADSRTGKPAGGLRPSPLGDHASLQDCFQLPRHRHRPTRDTLAPHRLSAATLAETHRHELCHLHTENARRLGDLLGDPHTLSTDVAGRWGRLLDRHGDVYAVALAGVPRGLPLALLVRPDGHIAGELHTAGAEGPGPGPGRGFCDAVRSCLGLAEGRL